MKEKPGVDETGPARFVAGEPVLRRIAEAVQPMRICLVGGAVRDAMLGEESTDIDLVIEGDAIEVAAALSEDYISHDRFRTAVFTLDGVHIDLAMARSERYPHPGSLPEVVATDIEEDLTRRDFTINAIAVDLADPENLIDPLGGVADLNRGVIRVLHERSFVDDPTRAFRAARYAARLGFSLEPLTSDLLATANLSTISTDRLNAELGLIAAEPQALKTLTLVSKWGLYPIEPERLGLVGEALEISGVPVWAGLVEPEKVVPAAISVDLKRLEPLRTEPSAPSDGVSRARGFSDVELLLARASGYRWLDFYVGEWRKVEVKISGEDLVRAGVAQGPEVGRGLRAALVARLDHGVKERTAQLDAALAAVRR